MVDNLVDFRARLPRHLEIDNPHLHHRVAEPPELALYVLYSVRDVVRRIADDHGRDGDYRESYIALTS